MLLATIPATDSTTNSKKNTKAIRRIKRHEETARNAGPEWSATRD